jgi:hypothetical protein
MMLRPMGWEYTETCAGTEPTESISAITRETTPESEELSTPLATLFCDWEEGENTPSMTEAPG